MSLDTEKPLDRRLTDFIRIRSEEERHMRDPDVAPVTDYAKMLQSGRMPQSFLSSIWFDAAEKPQADNAPYHPDSPEALLREKSGNYHVAEGRANLGQNADEEEKKKNKERALSKAVSNTLSIGGSIFTQEQVVDNLTGFASFQQSMVDNNPPQTISESALLHLDQNGRPVAAGTPGARLVATEEERLAAEAKASQCFIGISADQTTVVDGVRIDAKEYENQQATISKIEETKLAIAKLESGEMKLSDLPEDMQASVKYWEENGDRLTELTNNSDKLTLTERMEMETARNEFMGEDLPHKMPMRDPVLDSLLSSPVPAPQQPANAPAPPMSQMAFKELAPAA